MARTRAQFTCGDCGTSAPQWAGRCPGCGQWNSLVEELVVPDPVPAGPAAIPAVVPITDIDPAAHVPLATGLDEADRVLGGGLVPGSVTLLAGSPGVGKSTLVLQIVSAFAGRDLRALYLTAEESGPQVRSRAERLGALDERVALVVDTSLAGLDRVLDEVKPDLLVVDSIQSVHDPELTSAAGSVAQVRHGAQLLARLAKDRGVATVLVGHVTKEGAVAGPRVLEHLVDTVLEFEGDLQRGLRVLRATKHRFGATDEVGLFEMGSHGLASVVDPSAVFLADRVPDIPGSIIVPTAEGRRPLLVEIQALTNPAAGGVRRVGHGIDTGRLELVLAVLFKRLGLGVFDLDVHAAAVGGVQVHDPAADLALGLAVASSLTNVALPDDLVAFGEVGLAGELRRVPHTEQRLAEAARMGLRRAVVPRDVVDAPLGLEVRRAASLADAVRLTRLPVG
ncbi:MAG: DNA repair protein RadA [Acidimicrobiales bacterium]